MDYREIPPPQALAGLVKAAWTLAVRGDARAIVGHKAMPDGCVEIIRCLKGRSAWRGQQPASFVAGIITAPAELEFSGDACFVALRLWPWTWNALGRTASPALVDTWQDLAEAAPGLALPTTPEAAMAEIAGRLVGLAADPVPAAILMSRSVAELASRSGLSHRATQRWFERNVGVAPRQYLRLLRFEEALTGLQDGEGNLADHAAAHGFSDQAHMAREFRAIAGTPAGSARRNAKGPFL